MFAHTLERTTRNGATYRNCSGFGARQLENTAQACVFACQCLLARRKHCPGLRLCELWRGCSGGFRGQKHAQACVFASTCHFEVRKPCAGVRFRLTVTPWHIENTAQACVFA